MSENEPRTSLSVGDLFPSLEEPEENGIADYWGPLSRIIVEFAHMRESKDLSQEDVAGAIGSRQSVVSRFENMGRKPSYDFLVRLSNAVGGRLGITLDADYMVMVPYRQRQAAKSLAARNGVSVNEVLERSLSEGIKLLRQRTSPRPDIDRVGTTASSDAIEGSACANATSDSTSGRILQFPGNASGLTQPPKVEMVTAE